MWRGDVRDAELVYSLGPAVFTCALLLSVCAGAVVVTGRALRAVLPRGWGKGLVAAAGLAVAAH